MADQNFRVKRGLEVGIGGTVLTATQSGNIGINSISPKERLDIIGNAIVSGNISASGFIGPLTGNVTGNLIGEVNAATFDTNESGVVVTGVATATSFSGPLIGNVTGNATSADQINIETKTLDDNTYYVPFEAGIGYTSLYIDTALSYNPGQDLLSLTNIQGTRISLYEGIDATGIVTASGGFVGNLTGNVTGNLTGVASKASQINISSSGSETDYYPMMSQNSSGYNSVRVDSGIKFNTLQNLLTVTNIYSSGVSTFYNFVVTGVSTIGNTIVGGATTELVVNGDARITGILTVGSSSVTINGTTTEVHVGSATTIHTGGYQIGNSNIHTSGATLENSNVLGVSTIGSALNVSSTLSVTSGGVSVTGVTTATEFHTGSEGSAIRINSNTISGPTEITIDPSGIGDNTGAVRIKGDLFVDGTQTFINSETITLGDFIVGIASTATSDLLADGAGIQIGPDNTLLYDHINTSLKASENFNIASGKTYKIDGADVLSATSLGSAVVNSSLTSVGNLEKLVVTGVTTASSFVKSGGTSSEFLKADGTVDSNTYLTSFTETNDLTAAVTWANVPDANITETSVTQHEAALSIAESQIAFTSSFIELTNLSIGTPAAASGSGSISYNNTSGVFTFTPPDLSGYLTSFTETNDLTAAVTWANVPDANITETSVTQHEAALSIGESQISFTSSFIELTDLSIGTPAAASGSGSIAYNNTTGVFTFTPPDLSGYLTSFTETQTLDDVLTLGSSSTTGIQVGISTISNQLKIISNDGTGGRLDLYCEVGNIHYTRLQAAPHGSYTSGNANVIVPSTSGTLLLTDGDGSSLSNIVTSISAGAGIWINQSTGNITIASTVTDSDLNSISINALSDVDTTTTSPSSGDILKWDGSKWAPAADAGGIALTDLSITTSGTASGGGSLSYNNTSGVFTFTPADISGSGGSSTFLGLTDTPGSFTASKYLAVNSAGDAIEFVDAPTGGGGGGGAIGIGTTFPESSSTGDLFYNTEYGKIFVQYDSFWVDSSPQKSLTPDFSQIDSDCLPITDNTYDMGSTQYRWKNIYTTDLHLSNEGRHNDVDGTWGNYTIQEGEEDLFLINRRTGKKYKFLLQEVQ